MANERKEEEDLALVSMMEEDDMWDCFSQNSGYYSEMKTDIINTRIMSRSRSHYWYEDEEKCLSGHCCQEVPQNEAAVQGDVES